MLTRNKPIHTLVLFMLGLLFAGVAGCEGQQYKPLALLQDDTNPSINWVSHPSPVRPTVVNVLSCPSDMVLVEGSFCPDAEEHCETWAYDSFMPGTTDPLRCLRFRTPNTCTSSSRHIPMRFCMDRYEYPNIEGAYPPVYVSWHEARTLCSQRGRRLCTSNEWTMACEGGDVVMNPYPYGLVRDQTVCRIDVNIAPDRALLGNPATQRAELERVYSAVPSGSRPLCVSRYGVHDMTGNVDEWVVNERGHMNHPPYRSGLKGGYWGPVRTRCRPMTTIHGPTFSYYQIGFRCCGEVRPGSS